MPKYTVRFPITGYVDIDVEADNKEHAKAEALGRFNECEGEGRWDCMEWEIVDTLCSGNVCSAACTEFEVMEL